MASKYLFRAVIFILIIVNLNLLNAQQSIKIVIGDLNNDFLSQPTSRPEYLKTQSQSSEPVIVILVKFPDTDMNKFAKTTQDDWSRIFFGSKPSVRDYFENISQSKLILIPASQKNANNKTGVCGWYTLQRNYSSYKSEDNSLANAITDVLYASANDIEYSTFDTAPPYGYISTNELHIFIIFAAFVEQIDPSPPRGEPTVSMYHVAPAGIEIEVGGVKLVSGENGGGLSIGAELIYTVQRNFTNVVGFLAHEMGHDLGLSDHYTYTQPFTADLWCLMGTGATPMPSTFQTVVDWNYPNFPCAAHLAQLRRDDPPTISADGFYNISELPNGGTIYKLWENGNPNQEYFLVENRNKQPLHNYDHLLPSSGLLIWHVDSTLIKLNDPRGIALEEADNNNYIGDAGDPFSQAGNAHFLPLHSTPNSRKNPPDNDITGVAVYNISAPGAVMTANIKVTHVPNQILCNSSTNSIPANGNSTATIAAYLLDTWLDTVESATNQVTFSITSGAASGQLIGNNPMNAVNGVATITLRSTTTAGTVTIEATSPNLGKASTSVYVYSTFNPTEVGGEIKTNTTWTLTKSPYLVVSDIQVHSNATLTIEPGVVVLFKSGTGLRIAGDEYWNDKGSLKAQGTASSPILFTSSSGNIGDWKGILFDEASDQDVSSIMTYCIVEKAGQTNARGNNANIACRRTNTPAMSNCTIQNSSVYGIYLDTSSSAFTNNTIVNSSPLEIIYLNGSNSTLNGNTITGNGSAYWLYCINNSSNPIISNNNFNGNVKKSIRLGTNFQLTGNSFNGANDPSIEVWGGDLNTTRTWARQIGASIYKIVSSDLHVHNSGSLTLAPGITVLFNSGTGLRIAGDDYWNDRGSLTAEGTASNPIIFSSASGNLGDWKGVLFDEASDNGTSSVMSYCIVEKSGQANARAINANITCRRTNTPAMNNCTIRNSSGYGFYFDTSSPTISNNSISNSSNFEVFYLNGSTATINNNTIAGNGSAYWLYCATNATNPTIINNVFAGSVNKAMRLGTNFQLSGNSLSGASDLSIEVWGGDLNTIRTWQPQTGTSTYKIVSSDLHVHSDGSLTIEPGITLLFNSGTGLRIAGDDYWNDRGALNAAGTVDKPIAFRSASGNVGDWKGILFDEASDKDVSSIMRHCVVEKAGQANARSFNSAIHCKNTTSPVITQTKIQNNASMGLSCDYASPLVTNCKIINNLGYGIYCSISSHPTIGNAPGATNDIYGNGTYDIYVAGADNINARYNYWGTTNEAQIKTRIYDKYDNPNSGEVFYSPWETQSGGANMPPTAFSLFSPLNKSIVKTLSPTLIWQKSEDVDGSSDPIYTVQVGMDSTFARNYYEFYDIKQESYTVSQTLTDKTKYFWRVKATDEKNASTWSNEIWSFVIDLSAQNHPPTMPTALLPINGEEARPDDYLVWSKSMDPDVGDVITYTLELDNNSNFSSPEVRQTGISGMQMNNEMVANIFANLQTETMTNAVYIQIRSLQNFNNLKDDSTYYWRVKAVDQYGAESNFTSGTSRFFFNKTNTAPQPVIAGFSPKDGIEVRTNKPELSWHPAKDADLSDHAGTLRYKLQLDDDGEFVSNYKYQYTTAMGLNTFEVPDPLSENVKWYYRVQAVDDEGLFSTWSAVQNFWVNAIDEAPRPFALYAPANNSAVSSDTLKFSWASTYDVDPNDKFSFTMEYSTSSSFSENVNSIPNLTDSTFIIETKGMRQTVYYWRVKAVDSDGLVTWGSNSGISPWSFQCHPTAVFDDHKNIPQEFHLSQNHPNPFNPETVIDYQLPISCHVVITIYNTLGQEIRRLIDNDHQAGYHQILWDGKDNSGNQVGTGIYLYQMRAGEFVAVKKMILIQ